MRVYASSVQQIIDAINSPTTTEISLAPGTYEISAAYSGLSAFPLITGGRKLIVFGNNAAIVRNSGASNFRFFELQNAQLTLNNLTLRNGKSYNHEFRNRRGGHSSYPDFGSGIETILTIQDCIFDLNSATSTGAGQAYGGAISIGYLILRRK